MSPGLPNRSTGAPVDPAIRFEEADRARDHLRAAIDDSSDSEHESACDFRDAFGRREDVEDFLESYDGEADVERVAEAAKAHGIAEGIWGNDLNLGLLTLMVDEAYRPEPAGEVIVGRFLEGESSTQRTRESGEALARRLLREIEEERASEEPYARLVRQEREARDAAAEAARERLKGPHIQIG